jgi:hypothetical protein
MRVHYFTAPFTRFSLLAFRNEKDLLRRRFATLKKGDRFAVDDVHYYSFTLN